MPRQPRRARRRSGASSVAKARTTYRRCQLEALEPIWVLTAAPANGGAAPDFDFIVPVTFQAFDKDQKDPAVAKASSTNPLINGDFVVVWEHEFNSPTNQNNTDIRARLYDANGFAKGADFPVSNDDELDEQDPRVSMAADGSFVVVWEQVNDNGDFDVMFKVFDQFGSEIIGGMVHEADELDQTNPDVAMFLNGDFAVVWTTEIDNGNGPQTDVQFRRFDFAEQEWLDRNPVDVSNDATRDDSLPRVAAGRQPVLNNRTFVISWTNDAPNDQLDIYRDIIEFRNGRSAIGGRNLVTDDNDITNLDQPRSSVAIDALGQTVVTWAQETTNGNHDIFFKLFDDDGDPVGNDQRFIVSEDSSLNTNEHEVTMSDNGLILVVFQIANSPSTLVDVRYRMFNYYDPEQPGRTNLPIDPGAINTISGTPILPLENFNQDNPAVAMNATGDFTIVWDDTAFSNSGFRQEIIGRNYRNVVDTVGAYQPSFARYLLRNSNSSGTHNLSLVFGRGSTGLSTAQQWKPLAGDWDGDGTTTIGVYEPSTALYFLANNNNVATGSAALPPINFGIANAGWIPIVGDWDGDGVQTIGAYNPIGNRFFLRNSNTTGAADVTFRFGSGGGVKLPIVGDWDGDGIETVGIYFAADGRFLLTNDAAAPSDQASTYRQFTINSLRNGQAFAGDYERDGIDAPGVYIAATSTYFLLSNILPVGTPVVVSSFNYGVPDTPVWIPIFGDWDGPEADPLFTAESPLAVAPGGSSIDTAAAQAMLPHALAAWAVAASQAGLATDLAQRLAWTNVTVRDLGGSLLGLSEDGGLVLDDDAAGHGWFIDDSPTTAEEFAWVEGRLQAIVGSQAAGHYDLLTALAHELGHSLGLDHDAHDGDVMAETLSLGVRQLPDAATLDRLFGG